VRHFQAFAARWMETIFQSELALRRFLIHVCATATRLAAAAARTPARGGGAPSPRAPAEWAGLTS